MEMIIKIEAPDLAAAMSKLADAIAVNPHILTPDEPVSAPEVPVTPPPVPVDPVPTAGNPVVPVAPAQNEPTGAAPAAPVTPPAAPVAPEPAVTAPAVPVAEAPTYTLQQISTAGAALVDAGKMEPLLALLAKYGVAAVTQLSPEQYGAFATELRGLGAQI